MADPTPIITLTTDFGLADGTVGAMIGVMKSICPRAEVVNLSSAVPAHDIPRGAWALFQAAPFFPAETIHVAVIDPGVGSDRRGILAVTDHGVFVGPDNGVLSWAWRNASARWVHALTNPSYRISRIGVTFDGRDLFAPAAAHLALGVDPRSFGPEVHDPVELDWPEPRISGGRIEGEILVVDHFGNLVTSVSIKDVVETFGDEGFHVRLTNGLVAPFVGHYAQIHGELGAVVNGAGLIEIAVRESSAAARTQLTRGARIVLERGGDSP